MGPRMCEACSRGLHWLCGMQTWCECDCDGPEGIYGFIYDGDPILVFKPDIGDEDEPDFTLDDLEWAEEYPELEDCEESDDKITDR